MVGTEARVHAWWKGSIVTDLPILSGNIHYEKAAKKSERIYQLKVTLNYIKPPVWRRIEVPDCSLGDLHEVIQIVMGWQNSHMHRFVIGGTYYGPTTPDDFGIGMDTEVEDGDGILLSQIVKGDLKVKIRYEYDFGDGWQHEILFERAAERVPKAKYPRCVGGARACPPEDVGGPWGYAEFLAAVADPKHENHRENEGVGRGQVRPGEVLGRDRGEGFAANPMRGRR